MEHLHTVDAELNRRLKMKGFHFIVQSSLLPFSGLFVFQVVLNSMKDLPTFDDLQVVLKAVKGLKLFPKYKFIVVPGVFGFIEDTKGKVVVSIGMPTMGVLADKRDLDAVKKLFKRLKIKRFKIVKRT